MQVLRDISHIGDILAIPLFLISIIYFYQIKNKTFIEYILLLFTISGFILDIIFTIVYFKNKRINKRVL